MQHTPSSLDPSRPSQGLESCLGPERMGRSSHKGISNFLNPGWKREERAIIPSARWMTVSFGMGSRTCVNVGWVVKRGMVRSLKRPIKKKACHQRFLKRRFPSPDGIRYLCRKVAWANSFISPAMAAVDESSKAPKTVVKAVVLVQEAFSNKRIWRDIEKGTRVSSRIKNSRL